MSKKINPRDLVRFTLGKDEHVIKVSIGMAALIEELTGKSCARLLHTFAAGRATVAQAADVLRAAMADGDKIENRAAIISRLDNERDFLHAHKIATNILMELFKPRADDKPGNAEAATR